MADSPPPQFQLFALVGEIMERAPAMAAPLVAETPAPISGKAAGRIQNELRRIMKERFPLFGGFISVGTDLTSYMNSNGVKKPGRRQQMASLLSFGEPQESLAFEIATHSLAIADHIIGNMPKMTVVLENQDAGHLHGFVRGKAIELYNRLNSAEPELRRRLATLNVCIDHCVDALREGLTAVGLDSDETARWLLALAHLSDPQFKASLEAPIFRGIGSVSDANPQTSVMESYALILSRLCESISGFTVTVETYMPTPAGDSVVTASSRPPAATHPLAPWGPLVVFRGRLHGGAAVLSLTPFGVDYPDETVISNYTAERPDRSYAVPVPIKGGVGNLIVSLYGQNVPRLESLQWLKCLALCLGDRLSEELVGHAPDVRWTIYHRPTFSEPDLQARLEDIIASVDEGNYESRLALVVVSARWIANTDDLPDNERITSLTRDWSKMAALRRSAGKPVYEIGGGKAYVYVAARVAAAEWRQRRDLKQGRSQHAPGVWKGVAYARRADDGTDAMAMGVWSVVWRYDQIVAAREQIPGKRFADLIKRQIHMAAECIIELNNMLELNARGQHGKALTIAKSLVRKRGSVCGVAVNDSVRLAIMVGDIEWALETSQARIQFAGWDIDAHTNYLLAMIMAGDAEGALVNLESCETCKNLSESFALDPAHATVYPMMAVAQGLARIARSSRGAYGRWSFHNQIEAALETMSQQETGYRGSVMGCIEAVYLYFTGVRPTPPDNRLYKTWLALANAGLDELDRHHNWSEIERLKRLTTVLIAMVRNTKRDAFLTQAIDEAKTAMSDEYEVIDQSPLDDPRGYAAPPGV